MSKNFSTKHIAIAAGLSAVSAVMQLNHVGYQSPTWGMWIDVVAISWFVAYFLFGFKLSMTVSLLGALVITLFAPDTWLGAGMKFVATVSVIFALYFFARKSFRKYKNLKNLIAPTILGIVIRCLVVLPLNYYYAIPIWTKMTPEAAWAAIPWYIIAVFNIAQTIIDVYVAWVLVYKFKLIRYSRHVQTESTENHVEEIV